MDPYVHIAQRLFPGARPQRRWPLAGGASAEIEALELTLPSGQQRTVVVRRPQGAAGSLRCATAAQAELELLQVLRSQGLPVPQPLLLETANHLLGSAVLVLSYVEASTAAATATVEAALSSMADCLRQVHHSLETRPHGLRLLEDPVAGALSYLPASDPAYGALQELGSLPSVNRPCLLHGDYWPGNILWRDGRIVAVIDWEDAAWGDPLSDLAGGRLELLWKYDAQASDRFLEHYLRQTELNTANLPFWELYCAAAATDQMAGWGLSAAREAELRRRARQGIERARRKVMGAFKDL